MRSSLFIILILIAGCTGSNNVSAPQSTPTPDIVVKPVVTSGELFVLAGRWKSVALTTSDGKILSKEPNSDYIRYWNEDTYDRIRFSMVFRGNTFSYRIEYQKNEPYQKNGRFALIPTLKPNVFMLSTFVGPMKRPRIKHLTLRVIAENRIELESSAPFRSVLFERL